MSRRSRKRNLVLGAIGLGMAASKLGLLKSAMGKSDVVSQAAKARKASIMPIRNLPKAKEAVKGITKLSPSAVGGKNPKSIFRNPDGSITKGLEKFKNKEAFSKAMRERRGERGSGGFKTFLNKFILGPKTQLRAGKMVKARGGGMARNKPTKLY